MRRLVDPDVGEAGPDAGKSPLRRCSGKKRTLGEGFVEILVDNRRFPNAYAVMDEQRNLAGWRKSDKLDRLAPRIDFDLGRPQPFLAKRQPYALGIGTKGAAIQVDSGHEDAPVFKSAAARPGRLHWG